MALLVGAGIVGATQSGKAPLALPAIRADLGLGLIAAGLVVSMFHAITGLTGAAAGIVGDRFGHRRVLLIAYLLLMAGGVLGWLAPDGTVLLISRFVEGVGFVGVTVSAPALLARVAEPRHHRLVFGLYGTNFPAGVAIMMVVAAILLPPFGWRGLWFANVILCGVMLLLLLRSTRALGTVGDAPVERRSFRDLKAVVLRPGPWLLSLTFVTYGTLWAAVVLWLPTYMVEEEHRSVLFASRVGAVIVGANAAGNVIGARLNPAGAPAWLLIAIGGAVMGVLARFIFPPEVPELAKYALAFAFSAAGGLIPSSLLGSAAHHAPSPSLVGSTLGLIFQGAHVGSFAGPPLLAAAVALGGGWSKADWPLLACGLLVVALALALRRVERRMRKGKI
ncbi:MAG: MFS transporter [Candidatus Eiseniibacteriota bacterium]